MVAGISEGLHGQSTGLEDARLALKQLDRSGLGDSGGAGRDDEKTVTLTVSNELDADVTIEAADGSGFMLSPLEGPRSVTDSGDRAFALRCWPGIVTLEPRETRKRRVVALLIAYGIGFFFVTPWAITRAFLPGAPRWWQIGWAAFGGLVVTCGVIDLLRMKWPSSGKSPPAPPARWPRSVGGPQPSPPLGVGGGGGPPAAGVFVR